MKGIKIEFKHDFAEGLIQIIDELMKSKFEDDDDKLVMAGLVEIKQRILTRFVQPKSRYTMTLSAVQSFSIRILHNEFLKNHEKTYMGMKLLQISNDVEKQYQS